MIIETMSNAFHQPVVNIWKQLYIYSCRKNIHIAYEHLAYLFLSFEAKHRLSFFEAFY